MSRYSHAGGIVVRTIARQQEYLLVEARRRPGEWVLPKSRRVLAQAHALTSEDPPDVFL